MMRLLALGCAALALGCATRPDATVVYLGISDARQEAPLIRDTVSEVAQAWNLTRVTLNPGFLAEEAYGRGPSNFTGALYILVDVLPRTESVFIELALEPGTAEDSASFDKLCAELERRLESHFADRVVARRSTRPFPEEGRALQQW